MTVFQENVNLRDRVLWALLMNLEKRSIPYEMRFTSMGFASEGLNLPTYGDSSAGDSCLL